MRELIQNCAEKNISNEHLFMLKKTYKHKLTKRNFTTVEDNKSKFCRN